MLQTRFEKQADKTIDASFAEVAPAAPATKKQTKQSVTSFSKFYKKEGTVFKWGVTPENQHPEFIGKNQPHPSVQDYEATPPPLTAMVLNIFGKFSSGDGGLMLAMEVPSPCDAAPWVEVDRARCSSKYPCALRLPAGAVKGDESNPTKFRTRVIAEYDDYHTDFLQYERVSLDHDAEVQVAQAGLTDLSSKRVMAFNIHPAIAAGSLSVTPVLQGANSETKVSMRIRQPDPKKGTTSSLLQSEDMSNLQTLLQSYRAHWADNWRETSRPIGGCSYELFEVVADQLYPGDAEIEIWTSNNAIISDVLVTTRASWAEAEVSLLDTVMKDHFGFFNDPEVIVHGLPMDAYKKDNPGRIINSNPTSWGYAMESWVVMSETGVLTPVEAAVKLNESLQTLSILQNDINAFDKGMYYPYFQMRNSQTGQKIFPVRTPLQDMPCGDDALFYASMMTVQGWLGSNNFHAEADHAGQILARFNFSKCQRFTDCNQATNGQAAADPTAQGDKSWGVPLTFHVQTDEPNLFNWNVWADEGGIVSMIVAMSGALTGEQFESVVEQQQKYSPCAHWEGVTVGHTAFFNSIFTLPTRSLLGFGTLFVSPYYHEFAVRSVLPSFRAHQKLKKKLGLDYMGPSDAMTQMPKNHPGRMFGSYAYWPPNNFYDCRKKFSVRQNECTWCNGRLVEGLPEPVDTVVPHGNMVSFLTMAMMERSLFKEWLEDTKLLKTDASGVYQPGYGAEVVAPAKRTPLGGTFDGAFDGRHIWEALSHGYSILSMYEGLATMRRRYDLLQRDGFQIRGTYQPPSYKPLSDFLDVLPGVRGKINSLDL